MDEWEMGIVGIEVGFEIETGFTAAYLPDELVS